MYQEGRPPQSHETAPSPELQRRTERVERVLGNLPLAILYFSAEERLAQKFVTLPNDTRVNVQEEIRTGILAIQEFTREKKEVKTDTSPIQAQLDEARRRLEGVLPMLTEGSSAKERFEADRERFKTRALLYEVALLSDVLTTLTEGRLTDKIKPKEHSLTTDPIPAFTRQEFLPPDVIEPATEEAEEERREHRFTGGERSLLARHLFESRGWPYRSFVGLRREGQRRTLPYEALHVQLPTGREAAVFLNDGTEQATYVVRDLPFKELDAIGEKTKSALRAMRQTTGRVNWFGVIDHPQKWELQLAHLLLKANEEPAPDLSNKEAHPWTNRGVRNQIERELGYFTDSTFIDRIARVLIDHFGESPNEIGRVMLRGESPSICFTQRMAEKIIDTLKRYRNPDPEHWKTLRGTVAEAKNTLNTSFDYVTVKKVAQYLSRQKAFHKEDEAYFFSGGGAADLTMGNEEENPLRLARYFAPPFREQIIKCLNELTPPKDWRTIYSIVQERKKVTHITYERQIELLENNPEWKNDVGWYISTGKNKQAVSEHKEEARYGVNVTRYISPRLETFLLNHTS